MRQAAQNFSSPGAVIVKLKNQKGKKKMSDQQTKLLDILVSGQKEGAPAELAARPHSPIKKIEVDAKGNTTIYHKDGSLTTATVSGPLNIPDFDAIRRNQPPAELGSGHDQVASGALDKHVIPRSVPVHGNGVSRPGPSSTTTPPVPVHTIGSTVLQAPQPTQPAGLLTRQQQATPVQQQKTSTTQDLRHFDKRGVVGAQQKNALISLFGVQGPASNSKVTPTQPDSPVSPLPQRRAVPAGPPVPESGLNSSPISADQQKFLMNFLQDFASGKH